MISFRSNAILWMAVLFLSACGAETPVSEQSLVNSSSANGDSVFRAWGVATSDAGDAVRDQTIRTVISSRANANRVRLVFSNLNGTSDLVLQSVRVANHAGGSSIEPASEMRVRFQSSDQVSIPPGETRQSDLISFSIEPFRKIAVSYHVKGESAQSTRHFLGNETSYSSVSGGGVKSGSNAESDFPNSSSDVLYLSAIDATANQPANVVVAVGDSITDGYVGSSMGVFFPDESAVDTDQRYPDFLARRLIERTPTGKQWVVINSGISGNRLLSDAMVGFPRFGPALLSRLQRDVIDVPGVNAAIVLIGTNDLGLAPPYTGDQVIAGLETLVKRLKQAGIRVYLGTQTPSQGLTVVSGHGLPTAVAFRNQINDWTRTQTLTDGVIDFAQALKDPNNPDAMDAKFDSGDRLHPNVAGYKAMADAIDLNLFSR